MKKIFWGTIVLVTLVTSCKQQETKQTDTNASTTEQKETTVTSSTRLKEVASTDEQTATSKSVEVTTQTSSNVQTAISETSTSTENDSQIEEHYYTLIKEAKQKQTDYINSIEDPTIKQSVQSSYSAAIFESTSLTMSFPDDQEPITRALQRVLSEK